MRESFPGENHVLWLLSLAVGWMVRRTYEKNQEQQQRRPLEGLQIGREEKTRRREKEKKKLFS